MSDQSEVVVKTLPERCDPIHSPGFRHEMRMLARTDQPRIVLDLSAVKDFDSTSIETLLHCLSAVVRADGELKLAALSPEAAIILGMTRVDRFFEIFSTVEEAVHSFDSFSADSHLQAPWNSFSIAPKQEVASGPRDLGSPHH